MKKKLIYLLSLFATVIFYSCDYNEKYFGLTDENQYTETEIYSYTIADTDFSTIAKALNANKNAKDSAMAKTLEKDKIFSVNAPASVCIPYLLKTKYIGANKGTSAVITYNNKNGATGYYTLTAADYFNVWNNNTVKALTPAHSAATVIPPLLKTKFPQATDGDVRVVEYQYSATEPSVDKVTVEAFSEDFESYAAGSGVAVPTDNLFVFNKDVKGTFIWQVRTFNNNKYAQASSNKSGVENEIWLITKQINLSEATDNASFSFDVTAGFYNADCLSVLVSENFDGTEAGIAAANWVDVTSNFTLPKEPATGYGTIATAGVMDFKAYAGKKVYIAFKYSGKDLADQPKATTTFQVDNIKVNYVKTASNVAEVSTRFDYYRLQNGVWTVENKSTYQLTDNDYAAMGVKTLTTATAQNYVPTLLKSKYPYAQEGECKLVVFKVSGTSNNADEYVYTDGTWKPRSLIETKTEQFVFSGWDIAGWVFDPTLYVTMKKGKNDTDDYMLVVNYVKNKFAVETPKLVDSYGTAEFYYGFSAHYGNISLRESDRLKDPTYEALTTKEDKEKYMTERTNEGLAVYLSLKFPDAQPQVSGIDVYALVTTAIYDGATTSNYKYKFQRVDSELKWKFIERTKL